MCTIKENGCTIKINTLFLQVPKTFYSALPIMHSQKYALKQKWCDNIVKRMEGYLVADNRKMFLLHSPLPSDTKSFFYLTQTTEIFSPFHPNNVQSKYIKGSPLY